MPNSDDTLGCGGACVVLPLLEEAVRLGREIKIMPVHLAPHREQPLRLRECPVVIVIKPEPTRSIHTFVNNLVHTALDISDDCTPRGETAAERITSLRYRAHDWFADRKRPLLRNVFCVSANWCATYWRLVALILGTLGAILGFALTHLPTLVTVASFVWHHFPLLRLLIPVFVGILIGTLGVCLSGDLLTQRLVPLVEVIRRYRHRLEQQSLEQQRFAGLFSLQPCP